MENRLEDFDENPAHYYIAERPKVYKRSGDSKIYDERLIDIKAGGIYRSLHYIIKYKGYYVEVQGRTLFEEGWSEIDHDIVYPYFKMIQCCVIFNIAEPFVRNGGEMSSYFEE